MKVNPFHNQLEQIKSVICSSWNEKQNDRNAMILSVGMNYSLRAGELLSVTYNQIISGRLKQEKTGNTKQLRRLPALERQILEYITKYSIKPDKPLFYSNRGTVLSYQQLEKIIKQAGQKIGCKLGTHSIRKTGARIMFDKNKDTQFAMKLLGHSDLRSMFAYIGLTDEEFNQKSEEIGVI